MKITVCFKVLTNPDRVIPEDWDHFSLCTDLGYAGEDFNCFDESALEIALKLKEKMAEQGTEVLCSALTVSENLPEAFTERLYSVGFDQVLRIPCRNPEFSPESVAGLLARELTDTDLVLCGREAGMAETGMVPWYLAELLKLPLISGVETACWDRGLSVRCRDEMGLWEKKVRLPLVLTVDNSPEVLRMASLRQRMQFRGRKETLCAWDPYPEGEVPTLYRPKTGRICRMLNPADPETFTLVRKLLKNGAAGTAEGREREAQEEKLSSDDSLILFPDTPAGRRKAVEKAKEDMLPCFFGGRVTAVTEKTVTLSKRVFGSNLTWEKTLPLPAVLTRPELSDREPAQFPAVLAETLAEPREETDLRTAGAVMICGNGMGSKAACDGVRDYAGSLGAAFGLTRPAALNAWGSQARIVGQSGSVLHSDVCLTLGAAGAGPFLVGIEKVRTVIAVNRDPNALIFKSADYGIPMDVQEFMRKLQEG